MRKIIFISLLAVFVLVPFLADGQTTVYIRRKGEAPTPTPTPSPTPTPGLTWTHGSEFTSDGGEITPLSVGSYFGYATTDQSIDSEGEEDTYFEILWNPATPDYNPVYLDVYLAPAGGAPYSASPATTGVRLAGDFNGVSEWTGSEYTYRADDFSHADMRIGFTAAGNVRIWANGTPVWTSSGTYTGEFVLVIERFDEDTGWPTFTTSIF